MTALFISKSKEYGPRLMKDLGITLEDAVAILANLGHESGGFAHMQEIAPVSGRGGWGIAQWTGPRRRAMEAWCAKHGKSIHDFEANYQYLLVELRGEERAAIPALKAAKGLYNKVYAFERKFERAGIPAIPHRMTWANLALKALGGTVTKTPVATKAKVAVKVAARRVVGKIHR